MNIIKTPLHGVVIIEPRLFRDARGFFLETYSQQRYHYQGISAEFVQDNHSRSARHVLRGLHYQLQHPQGKLVRVARGEVYDVAVDIRVGSPSFGQAFGTILSEDNARQLYIPPGFAHGFQVISEIADFEYKCTDYYHPDDESGLHWNDNELHIDWPNPGAALLSEKDQLYPTLKNIPVGQLPRYQAIIS